MSKVLANRGKGGPIKWPALNLTLISGATLSVGAILTFWHEAFKALFGYLPKEHPGAAAAIFVSLVFAIGLIFAADLIARGVASSKVGDAAAMPNGWKATLVLDGPDEVGFAVAAVRSAGGAAEFLVVKEGKDASWHAAGAETGDIKLELPSS